MNLLLGKYSPIPYVLHAQIPIQARPPDLTGRIKSLFALKSKPQLPAATTEAENDSDMEKQSVDVWAQQSGDAVVLYKLSLRPHLWGELFYCCSSILICCGCGCGCGCGCVCVCVLKCLSWYLSWGSF
jgi:hypothetical protein